MKKNKGFTLIEVLLSLIILTVAIVSVNAAFKQFVNYKQKLEKYKKIYRTTLAIKDYIESKELVDGVTEYGELNGMKYSYSVKLVSKNRNFEEGEASRGGNTGDYELYLFKVTLDVEGRIYQFYETRYKKLRGFGGGL